MYPAAIEKYFRPDSISEAHRLAVESEGNVLFIAGGMSLMQAMKARLVPIDCLIDLNEISDLQGLQDDGEQIRIGSMTRYCTIARSAGELGAFQALSDAAAHVGDRQVRHRGTIGGSLSWNHVSACSPIAALAVDARLDILRHNGDSLTLTIDNFLMGPMTTALEDGDLLVSITLTRPRTAAGSAYQKWGIVKDSVPVIGVGIYLELSSANQCARARFAVGGLASGPQRSETAETLLCVSDLSDDNALHECCRAAAAEIETVDDPWISSDYRSHLIERLGYDVLTQAIARARNDSNG